jgi:hypothetical protein
MVLERNGFAVKSHGYGARESRLWSYRVKVMVSSKKRGDLTCVRVWRWRVTVLMFEGNDHSVRE